MGWDSCDSWKSVTDVKREILSGIERNGGRVLGMAGSSQFWLVVERENVRTLLVVLIETHKERGETRFYKKSMSEDSHPYYYDCPDKLVTLAGEPKSEEARNWREARAAYMAKKSKKWAAGDKCQINGNTYTVGEPHGRGYVVFAEDGRRYKAQPKLMQEVSS